MKQQLLANLVKELRLSKSWTQEQLATRASVSLRTIQRLEKSGHCSHETLLALADVFEVDVSFFTTKLYQNQVMKSLTQIGQKAMKKLGLIYLSLVTLVVASLAIAYSGHYSFINRNMVADNDSYVFVMKTAGGLIAIFMGVVICYHSLAGGKLLHSLVMLSIGLSIAIGAFSLLPWVYFPNDKYSAGAIWMFEWLPVVVGLWILSLIVKEVFHTAKSS